MSSPAPVRHPESQQPSVLFVCTGNVCRSPFAEHLLRDRLPGIRTASRGIFALEDRPMDSQMAGELSTRGVDPQGFRAHQVSAADLGADLILTMSRRQRTYLLDEFPAAVRRIGHMGHIPELARMASENPDSSLKEIISAWTRRAIPAGLDVPDPYGKDAAQAARTAALLTERVEQLVPVLRRGILAP
ncbi:arsenate reductase/protein-tyrosine-phosphatase family protein [Brachybacterium muris]|uniref:Phosphotyrosine protein phosphatase n=1 Tax=Brachybacterium muris UCD-AY4 TaxID=1249481 RepID=A0A022L029_9MICO|nr:low molecular weight phosphatase family protein [Brachybacterium muris]EYT49093.1 phosphotyrosine protein phosphatase [Brachybacterium muris UCD-AY4]